MGKMSKAQAELAELKYRPLKKRLKKSFSKLKDRVSRNEFPSRDQVEDFLVEAAIMVSYPGFGDEHYQDFTEACAALRKASQAKDLALFSERLASISRIKKDCHERFK